MRVSPVGPSFRGLFRGHGKRECLDTGFEISVLEAYMPKQLSEAEVKSIIDAAVASTGARSAADMGKVMGVVKPQLAGRADMGRVSGLVKARLAG